MKAKNNFEALFFMAAWLKSYHSDIASYTTYSALNFTPETRTLAPKKILILKK